MSADPDLPMGCTPEQVSGVRPTRYTMRYGGLRRILEDDEEPTAIDNSWEPREDDL